MRLDPTFRLTLYAVFFVLFVTGAAWLVADQLKEAPNTGEAWQLAGSYLLMLHGGAAMIALILLGALLPLHMQRAWRARWNRVAGAAMLACNAVLIVTAFGLYYAGSEVLRPWMSAIHIAFGFGLPAVFIVHLVRGRRVRAGVSTRAKGAALKSLAERDT